MKYQSCEQKSVRSKLCVHRIMIICLLQFIPTCVLQHMCAANHLSFVHEIAMSVILSFYTVYN